MWAILILQSLTPHENMGMAVKKKKKDWWWWPESPVCEPEACRLCLRASSQGSEKQQHKQLGQEILQVHAGPHMQTKPIRQGADAGPLLHN